MDHKEGYFEKVNALLNKLQVELEQLELKARQEGADLKRKYKKEIEAIQLQIKQAQEKFGALQTVSGPAWKEFKAGTEKAIEELKKSWKNASKKES